RDARADYLDGTGEILPAHLMLRRWAPRARHEPDWRRAAEHEEHVGRVERGGRDPHQYLTRTRRRYREARDLERLRRSVVSVHCGRHGGGPGRRLRCVEPPGGRQRAEIRGHASRRMTVRTITSSTTPRP